MKLQLTKRATPQEYPWLTRVYEKDEIVFKYFKPTYGCISPSGVACCAIDSQEPFFELPKNILKEIN